MPLRAIIDGESIIAPLLSEAQWEALRVRVAEGGLRVQLACCDRDGYLRTSAQGTRHFAHKRGKPGDGHCDYEGETIHHLNAKASIIAACAAAGYAAAPEVAREGWRADVLAAPVSGSAAPAGAEAAAPRLTSTALARLWAEGERPPRGAIAFEVQWSHLSLEDCQFRQTRYADDGVRGCWFFRRPPPALALDAADPRAWRPSRDLPLFPLVGHADGSFAIEFNRALHPIDAFVGALLGRRIRWSEVASAAGDQTLHLAPVVCACPACRRRFTVWHVQPLFISRCGLPVTAHYAADGADWLAWASLDAVQAAIAGRPVDAPAARLEGGRAVCPFCAAAHHAGALERGWYGTDAVRLAHSIDGFTWTAAGLPALERAWPHWCWPGDGHFCGG